MFRSGVWNVIGGIVCFTVGQAYAFSNSLSEEDFYSDMPLVLTATRLAQPIDEIPGSVTIIDRRLIEASGALEIPDLFRLVPGFQVTYGLSSQYVVTYHGQSDEYQRRMQVLVDGRSVYTPFMSSVPWSLLGLELDDIERIEVLRGPNASAYGSNAYTGTINIITRQPYGGHAATVKMTAGSLERKDVYVQFSDQIANGLLDYRVTARQTYNEGFEQIPDTKQLAAYNFFATLNLSPDDMLDLQLGSSKGVMEVGNLLDAETSPPRNNDVNSAYGYMRWTRGLKDNAELYVQFYHNRFVQDDSYSLGPLSTLSEVQAANAGSGMTDVEFAELLYGQDYTFRHGMYQGDARRYDLELQHTFSPVSNVRLVWGGNARLDRYQSDYLTGKPGPGAIDDKSLRLFVNTEWRNQSGLLVNLGLMAEENSIIGRYVSPRVGLNYHLNDDNTFRASVTRAVHTPSILEKNTDWAARADDGTLLLDLWDTDPDLKEETNTSYELGYFFSPSSLFIVDVKVFREQWRDVITNPKGYKVLNDTISTNIGSPVYDEIFVYTNGGWIDLSGVELDITAELFKGNLLKAYYSYVEVESSIQNDFDVNNNPLYTQKFNHATPKTTYGVLLSQSFSADWRAGLWLYSMDHVRWPGEGGQIESYERLDANISKKIVLDTGEIDLKLTIQNITDTAYNEFREQYIFERRAYLQFSYSY